MGNAELVTDHERRLLGQAGKEEHREHSSSLADLREEL
jgi:hypothetical protein